MILKLLHELNRHLKEKNIIGEVGICGGAVMCLVFDARESTKDVDAIFIPAGEIRNLVKKIAKDFGLNDDWLNDAAKSYFHTEPPKENVLELSNLRVWAPRADYMLAMKAISARYDSSDKDDLIFLINYLELKEVETILKVIEKYYPRKMIPAKTLFLVEEICEKL